MTAFYFRTTAQALKYISTENENKANVVMTINDVSIFSFELNIIKEAIAF